MTCAHSANFSGPFGCTLCPSATRSDGWQSLLNGLATAEFDRAMSFNFSPGRLVSPVEGINLWRQDPFAAKAVEALPEMEIKEGASLKVSSEKDESKALAQAEEMQDLWERLGFWTAYQRAREFERASGGATILLGVNDGKTDLAEPLDFRKTQSFDSLTVFEYNECIPTEWDTTLVSNRYRQPTMYYAGGSRIHHTRIIPFFGIQTSIPASGIQFGDNVFNRAYGVLRSFNLTWAGFTALIPDFAQAVFKMENLPELVARNDSKQFTNRFRAIEASRSIARAIVIGKNESYERQSTSLAGLDAMFDRCVNMVAAVLDTPVTILMGQAPAGLNATGEGDHRTFNRKARMSQVRNLVPSLRRVTEIGFYATGDKKPPEKWSVKPNSLWELTDKEQAEMRKLQSETDRNYYDMGALTDDQIAKNRFGPRGFQFDTVIDLEDRKAIDAPEIPDPTPNLLDKPLDKTASNDTTSD